MSSVPIAKISLEKFDSKDQILFDFDKSKGLENIIREVCKLLDKPQSKTFGLKLIPTLKNPYASHYITEENLHEINHNDGIKLVFSISYYVERIFNLFFSDIDQKFKEQSFQDLFNLSVDPEFINELARTNHVVDILNIYMQDDLGERENVSCLITILHLFQKGHITDVTPNFLNKTISIIKRPESTTDEVEYSLSLLQKILISKNPVFKSWNEQIIKEIPITELIPYIWSEDTKNLQYGALLLINTIIKSCKGDKKMHLIKEMNLKQNRENIYKYIIVPGQMDRRLEHELYVCQTFLLSLYTEALNSFINLDDNCLFKREEFELCSQEFELGSQEVKRSTVLMEFDENDQLSKHPSYENLASHSMSRFSLASIQSEQSESGERKSKHLSESFDHENITINYLTLEALRHYKKFHYKNFYQSQIEETVYKPGIFPTSERVVNMLAKVLHIGLDLEKSSTFYQPIVFWCSSKTPFFLELFSRTMWLLSKTRREMKASTKKDYNRVMNVLEKQIVLVLENKPMDFKTLTDEMSKVTFDTVMRRWQKEKEDELNLVIKTNPSIQELKKILTEENEEIIFQQRINCLLKGAKFPKVLEKKIGNNGVFVKLSDNLKHLYVTDKELDNNEIVYNICDVTHLALGKNCPHSALCRKPTLAFTVIVNYANRINFIAKDERQASYWTDAFSLLTERGEKSVLYQKELRELVNMDVRLKLLELQNVTIPKKAPPLPAYPPSARPPVPPKPKLAPQHIKR